jgi:hypothetical protein
MRKYHQNPVNPVKKLKNKNKNPFIIKSDEAKK